MSGDDKDVFLYGAIALGAIAIGIHLFKKDEKPIPPEPPEPPDLCDGVVCNDYCDGSTLYYDGMCNSTTGACEYSAKEDIFRCGGFFDEFLVLDLRFDEGGGNVVFDHSPYGNHGTIHGTPTWTDQGLRFNGVDTYVEVQPSESLDLSMITVLIEARPEFITYPHGKSFCLLSKGIGTSVTDESYSVIMRHLPYPDAVQLLDWRPIYSNTLNAAMTTTGMRHQEWHIMAGRYEYTDGSTPRHFSDSYIRSESHHECDKRPSNLLVEEPLRQTPDQSLYIGYGMNDPDAYFFKGIIRGVKIYNIPLSEYTLGLIDLCCP